jgi:hypothetical protein
MTPPFASLKIGQAVSGSLRRLRARAALRDCGLRHFSGKIDNLQCRYYTYYKIGDFYAKTIA